MVGPEVVYHVLSHSAIDDVELEIMLGIISAYIYARTRRTVIPTTPVNDRQLQLMGKMYTIAMLWFKQHLYAR